MDICNLIMWMIKIFLWLEDKNDLWFWGYSSCGEGWGLEGGSEWRERGEDEGWLSDWWSSQSGTSLTTSNRLSAQFSSTLAKSASWPRHHKQKSPTLTFTFQHISASMLSFLGAVTSLAKTTQYVNKTSVFVMTGNNKLQRNHLFQKSAMSK